VIRLGAYGSPVGPDSPLLLVGRKSGGPGLGPWNPWLARSSDRSSPLLLLALASLPGG